MLVHIRNVEVANSVSLSCQIDHLKQQKKISTAHRYLIFKSSSMMH